MSFLKHAEGEYFNKKHYARVQSARVDVKIGYKKKSSRFKRLIELLRRLR